MISEESPRRATGWMRDTKSHPPARTIHRPVRRLQTALTGTTQYVEDIRSGRPR
jgi:hypothetical protein